MARAEPGSHDLLDGVETVVDADSHVIGEPLDEIVPLVGVVVEAALDVEPLLELRAGLCVVNSSGLTVEHTY